jgi:diguanylate cyclase (GGDEF)-like protein
MSVLDPADAPFDGWPTLKPSAERTDHLSMTPRPLPSRAAARPAAAGRIAALETMAAAIAGAATVQDVLVLVAEEARRAVGADALALSRYEPDQDLLRVEVSVGSRAESELLFPVDESYRMSDLPRIAEALRHGVGYVSALGDPTVEPAEIALLRSLGKESHAGVPIRVDGALWGELWVASVPGAPRFTVVDLDLLRAVAGYVAIGVSRAALVERLAQLAFTDPLTGLANRRRLDEHLEERLARHEILSVLLCDLDGLKRINDGGGHAAGDRALVAVGAALVQAAAVCPGALVARTGGDEFCVALAGVDGEGAREVAERTAALLRAVQPGPLSVSTGIATATGPQRPADLMRAADAAQYEAKRSGPGRARLAGVPRAQLRAA